MALWDSSASMGSDANKAFRLTNPPCVQCPSSPGGKERTIYYKDQTIAATDTFQTTPSDYGMVHKRIDSNDGNSYGTPLATGASGGVVSIENITDGLSNTIFFHEHAGLPNQYWGREKVGTLDSSGSSVPMVGLDGTLRLLDTVRVISLGGVSLKVPPRHMAWQCPKAVREPLSDSVDNSLTSQIQPVRRTRSTRMEPTRSLRMGQCVSRTNASCRRFINISLVETMENRRWARTLT